MTIDTKGGLAMAESERAGLPPGPWRAVIGRDGLPKSFVDTAGMPVLYPHYTGERIAVSPEVVRAIEALPLLVEAMRKTVEDLEGPAESLRHRSAFRLREALALVEGKGGDGG